jgi:hypothetical protein
LKTGEQKFINTPWTRLLPSSQANAETSTNKAKGEKVDSKKERQMKEQNKMKKTKEEQEKRMREEKDKLYQKAQVRLQGPLPAF